MLDGYIDAIFHKSMVMCGRVRIIITFVVYIPACTEGDGLTVIVQSENLCTNDTELP